MSLYDLLKFCKLHPGHSDVARFLVLCPFHADQKPSLFVSKDGFFCFGCGASGGLADLIARIFSVSSLRALQLISKFNIQRETFSEREFDVFTLDDARLFFESLPHPSWSLICHHYLLQRGFIASTLEKFDVRINISSNYPVIIPLTEVGNFVGYICRRVDNGAPKYLYNRGFKRALISKELFSGRLLVVEGILDLMKAHQFGFYNSCALLGWKYTKEQANMISSFATSLVCALDNDEPGERGFIALKAFFTIPVIRFQFEKGRKDLADIDTKEEFLYSLSKTVNKM